MASNSNKDQDALQGVLVQEIPNVKAVQVRIIQGVAAVEGLRLTIHPLLSKKIQGDSDVELASGTMKVLLVTLDVGNPFDDPSRSDPFKDPSQGEKAKAVEPEA